jgi:hypothetical protein
VEQEFVGLRKRNPPVIEEKLCVREVPEAAVDGAYSQAKRVGDPLDPALRRLSKQSNENKNVLAPKHARRIAEFSSFWKLENRPENGAPNPPAPRTGTAHSPSASARGLAAHR